MGKEEAALSLNRKNKNAHSHKQVKRQTGIYGAVRGGEVAAQVLWVTWRND